MDAKHKIWCDEDEHHRYEYYADFNEWLNGDEGLETRETYGIGDLSHPSKAFYAGDKEAYEQVFREFQIERRHEALNQVYLSEQFGGDHWFDRNHAHLEQLVKCMEAGSVIPFVGAGISVAGGFPSWKDHLREQGRTAGIKQIRIESLLSQGRYETVLEEIENIRGRDVFIQEIRDVFSKTGNIPETIWRISELFDDTVITTNYDRLIEQAYDTGEENKVEVFYGQNLMAKPSAEKVTIIKLHGDIDKPAQCILSKNQYDEVYGNDSIDLKRPIPKVLSYYYQNSSLLFLGSSLNNDRTVQLFQTIKKNSKNEELPLHFSIEQAPENEAELTDRHAYLVALGITPIWFEKNCFDYVESILRLVKSELSYKGGLPGMKIPSESNLDNKVQIKLDIDLSAFLRDFVDVMPLLYWLHRHVPKKESKKYLCIMQRIFYGYSLFTDGIDRDLIEGLDRLLRALSFNANLEGYGKSKLSVAFKHFHEYLQSIGAENDTDYFEGWDLFELLSIPASQFEQVIANPNPGDKPDINHHTLRLAIALLRYGRKQLNSRKQYLELPESVNSEFNDFIMFSISEKLGVTVPDRLDEIFTGDINSLCEDAWCYSSKEMQSNLLSRVKLLFKRF